MHIFFNLFLRFPLSICYFPPLSLLPESSSLRSTQLSRADSFFRLRVHRSSDCGYENKKKWRSKGKKKSKNIFLFSIAKCNFTRSCAPFFFLGNISTHSSAKSHHHPSVLSCSCALGTGGIHSAALLSLSLLDVMRKLQKLLFHLLLILWLSSSTELDIQVFLLCCAHFHS